MRTNLIIWAMLIASIFSAACSRGSQISETGVRDFYDYVEKRSLDSLRTLQLSTFFQTNLRATLFMGAITSIMSAKPGPYLNPNAHLLR
jgi:Na+/pantothenate symporter